MAYKKIEYGFSFADIAIKAYSDKNRNLLFLRNVEKTIDWQPESMEKKFNRLLFCT